MTVWIVLTCSITGCSAKSDLPPVVKPSETDIQQPVVADVSKNPVEQYQPERISDERLHNSYRLHERVISGGLPDEPSFQALKELGVKTVISVDGARPDVALAKKYGMRYVHLPHGYDGIPEVRVKELAKAVRDLEGPIFIHCHHGKHRSPSAAATACIAAGLIQPESGWMILKAAGTSENYRGLHQSVQEAHPIDKSLLNALNVEFKETADVLPMAEAMVEMEKNYESLKIMSENGWKSFRENHYLDSAHTALLLREDFTEMLRTEEVRKQPEEFQMVLRDSEEAAQNLESVLRAFAQGGDTENSSKEILEPFETISRNCNVCHQKFRDVPIRDKLNAK